MKEYRLGFQYKGLVAFILVMIPSVIWMASPPAINPLIHMRAPHEWLNIIMNVSQWIMLAMLCTLIKQDEEISKSQKTFFALAILCLISYYVFWIGYYNGFTNKHLLLGMAWVPSLLFIFVELWLENYWALIPSLIFLFVHTYNAWFSFL